MRKIFNCVSTTPIEAHYLESNTVPLRFVVLARRLMYYWGILKKTETELVKQVFRAQQLSPVKNDWCLKIKEDLAYLDIDKDESEISAMTKLKFEKYLNIKIKDAAQKYLSSLKNKHTKQRASV